MLTLFVCVFLYTVFDVSGNPHEVSIFNKFKQNDYKIKFERADVVSYDRRILKQLKITTFKHNRTCAAVNTTMQFNVNIGNELEMILQAYKFMSNEYRHFPLRFQVNFCFAITRNLGGVGQFFGCGNFTGCPIIKGRIYHTCNWTPDESKFPPFIPTGRYMIEMQSMYRNKEVAVMQSYAEVDRPIPIPD